MRGLIVVPAYNEEANLPPVIEALRSCLGDEQLLFVDDGSSDGTARVLQESGVNWLSHPVNLGYRETIVTGMRWGLEHGVDFVGFFDADGQHHTKDLMRLIETYRSGDYDVVLGSRYQDRNTPRSARGMGTRLFAVIASKYSGVKVTDPTCGLKLIGRRWLQAAVDLPCEDFHAEFIIGLARLGARFAELPIDISPRTEGTSMYHLSKAVLYPARTLLCVAAGYLVRSGPVEH